MKLPTAEKLRWLAEIGPEATSASHYLTRDEALALAAILTTSDAGKELEALDSTPVTVINGNRYVPDNLFDRALDLARTFAARISVLEAEREHLSTYSDQQFEAKVAALAERDQIEERTIERCAKMFEAVLIACDAGELGDKEYSRAYIEEAIAQVRALAAAE